MSADRVYAKTDKDRAGLLSRTGTLRGRLSAALVIVNGQAPRSTLGSVAPSWSASSLRTPRTRSTTGQS